MGHGICHIEIPCKDLQRIKDFYGSVFGWTFTDSGEMYTVFSTGEGPGGGFDLRTDSDPVSRSIVLYIEVEDIPLYLEKVSGAGGKIIQEKTEISKEFGYYALFADSEENTLGIWSET